ncbi:hypothetical protein ACFX15_027417 [Malus domestica]
MVDVEIEEPSKGNAITVEEERTLTPKEGLPTHVNIKEALRLPKGIRKALITVLASLDNHEVQDNKNEGLKLRPHKCATHDVINFTDEDLLLGSRPHNRLLLVSRYIREHKVNRMLMDGGSAINIMPKSTMIIIGIKVDELSLSCLLIQVEMTIGELKSSTIFHVIDVRTSYNLLLGRHWIHRNGVVPSTPHQC